MINVLATLFLNPVTLGRWQSIALLFPLCLAVSVVYKTTKCGNVRDIPLASVVSWITVVVGMYIVGMALLLLYEAPPRRHDSDRRSVEASQDLSVDPHIQS